MTGSEKRFLERRVGWCRMLDALMIAVLLITITIVAVLITTLTSSPSISRKMSEENDEECLDVAVVGAGIGGSYTAWRLRNRNLTVAVFEYSDRIGGRLFSTPLPVAPGTYLEFGGMRFHEDRHVIFPRTAIEIGLKLLPFPLEFGVENETIWYQRGKHMRIGDIGTNAMPYNLQPDEIKSIPLLEWSLFKNNVNISNIPTVDDAYTLVTSDGTPLYKMSLDNFYGRYASREAYRYLHELGGWATFVGIHSALSRLYYTYPSLKLRTGPLTGFKTVEGGMDKVPKTLISKFKEVGKKNTVLLNHQLMKISRKEKGGYNLRFRRTETTDGVTTPIKWLNDVKVCARKVALAVQKGCVTDIDFPVFNENPEILSNLNSVAEVTAGKIYLAYRSQWWKTNNSDITHTKTDLYNRQTYDWQTGTNNISIIMASYHDGENNVRYWRELSKFGKPIPGSLPGANAVTTVVKNRLEEYLRRIFDYQGEIPEAVGGGMVFWDSYPFYHAWAYLLPGYDERKVRDIVMKPSKSDDVYIVSNSWGPKIYTGWAEGSMLAADRVLKKYF